MYSNSIFQHSCLSDVVDRRVHRAGDLLQCFDTADLMQHLQVIPAEGAVALEIDLAEEAAELLHSAAADLGSALRRDVEVIHAISLLLFDLIVEANVTEVVTKLGISGTQAELYRKHLRRRPTDDAPLH